MILHSELKRERTVSQTLSWKTSLNLEPGETLIKSPVYLIESAYKSRWQIELNPNFVDDEGTRHLSLWVTLLSTIAETLSVYGTMEMETEFNTPNYIRFGSLLELSAECSRFGYDKFIEFYRVQSSSSSLYGSPLQFHIQLYVFVERIGTDEGRFNVPRNSCHHPQFDSPFILDAFLKLGDDLIQVDSARLSASSTVFESHFNDESTKHTPMDVAEYFPSLALFNFIVKYCHFGEVQEPKYLQAVVNVLKAANELKILSLKNHFQEVYLNRISVEDFVQAVMLMNNQVLDSEVAIPFLADFFIERYDELKEDVHFQETYETLKQSYEEILIGPPLPQVEPTEDMEDGSTCSEHEMEMDDENSNDSNSESSGEMDFQFINSFKDG